MWECGVPGRLSVTRRRELRFSSFWVSAHNRSGPATLSAALLSPLLAASAMTSTRPRPLPAILADIRAVHQRNAQQGPHDSLCTEMSSALTANEKEIQRDILNNRAAMQRTIDAKDALVQSCKAQLKALADLALGAAAADVHLVAKDKTRVPAQKSVLKKAIPRIVYGDLDVDASAGAVRLLVALLYCKDFPIGDDAELGLLIEACELATMWSGGARPATDEDPDEMVSVLQKLSEPLVAKAKESAAGAVAVLVAAERHHGHTAEDPAGPFWEKAEGEAQRALVNFEGTFRSARRRRRPPARAAVLRAHRLQDRLRRRARPEPEGVPAAGGRRGRAAPRAGRPVPVRVRRPALRRAGGLRGLPQPQRGDGGALRQGRAAGCARRSSREAVPRREAARQRRRAARVLQR